jgi:hypothetical protein
MKNLSRIHVNNLKTILGNIVRFVLPSRPDWKAGVHLEVVEGVLSHGKTRILVVMRQSTREISSKVFAMPTVLPYQFVAPCLENGKRLFPFPS